MQHIDEKITTAQLELLKQFRKNLSDVLSPMYTDAKLLKWLRAGCFNLRKCEVLFRENLATRALYDIDTFAEYAKKPEIFPEYEFVSQLGYTKDGYPVCYVAMGRADFFGGVSSMSGFEICKYCSLVFELDLKRAKQQSEKLGIEMNEITYIIDMEGFNLKASARQSVIEMALDLFRMLQDQYPEIWRDLLIVNVMSIFYKVFNFFKPILRRNLLQNINLATKETTPELLLKYIDSDDLPVFLGGKRLDSKGDPMCREFLKFGGEIPDDYYSNKRPLLNPLEAGVETVNVRPRSCYNHPLIVRIPNSSIRIEMRTEGGSIPTAILFRQFGPNSEIDLPANDVYLNEQDERCNVRLVSPCVKLQLHLSPADTSCRAPWPGLYIFRFDNTYNWMNTRKLIFRLQVIPPDSCS